MKKLNKYKEKILLFRIRTQGDKESYGELYDNYVDNIYRFIFFKVSSGEVAEDLTSETFLRTWGYLIDQDKGSKIDSFGPFIYKVARNLIIDHYRQRKEEENINEGVDRSDERLDIKSSLEINEEIKNLERGLRSLKEEYREVVILRHIEGLSIAETSSIIGKSKNNTRVLAHRAIKTLKEILSFDSSRQSKLKIK